MSDIKFYIPESETIPTELRLYVDDVYVTYARTNFGYDFHILLDDKGEALEVAKKIANKMINEHDESQYGVSWRTVSFEVFTDLYGMGTTVRWKYRVRDSY